MNYLCGAAAAAFLAFASVPVSAQDVAIVNARILDGSGRVIEHGSIVAHDGKIVSVADGAAAALPKGAQRIDARGMTALPAFIDAHRHVIQGDPQAWLQNQAPARMREFLDAGSPPSIRWATTPRASSNCVAG